MSEASMKFADKWTIDHKQSGATTSKGINSKFFKCTFHVNLGTFSLHIYKGKY